MYYRLTHGVKERIIEELRRYWQDQPRFSDLPNNIQGKYAYAKERPQRGIIVKVGSGSRMDLAADNYMGTVNSYVYQTKVGHAPGLSVEWVKEDARAIQDAGGVFPSAPGVYYIRVFQDVLDGVPQPDSYWFQVDPWLDSIGEPIALLNGTEGSFQNIPLQGSLRLYEMPSGWMLHEGVNYTVDYETGAVVLNEPITTGRYVQADYRYFAESRGPFAITYNHANFQAIPGCILAFGRRVSDEDVLAVVVQPVRRPAYQVYGGRCDISLDLDLFARDVVDQEEMVDETFIHLWGTARSRLSSEGIEIVDVSIGGESEEPYDEVGDDYFFNATLSMTVQTAWEIHVPILGYLRMAAPLTVERAREIAGLPDDQLQEALGDIQALESLGLQAVSDPFFQSPSTFESFK